MTATYGRAGGETVAGSPYHITATLSSTVANALNNYIITNAGADFTIKRALLTVSTNPASSQYSDPLAPLTYTITGFVNGETMAVVSGSPVVSTTATSSSAPANYPITITFGDTRRSQLHVHRLQWVDVCNHAGRRARDLRGQHVLQYSAFNPNGHHHAHCDGARHHGAVRSD